MARLEFLISGCGKAAEIHVLYIKKYGKLVAVCDPDEEKGMAFAKKHGCAYYYDIISFIDSMNSVDVAVICSPNGYHYLDALFALRRSFNVLIEKPMALSVNSANEMILKANEMNLQLFTVMQNRFNPPIVALKKALDLKKLGRIYSVQVNGFWNRNDAYYADEWHGTKGLDGGVLFTQFSHFIDLIIWFFGMPQTVNRVCNNIAHQKVLDLEDQGLVTMEWKNGMIGSMHYSINAYKKNREGSITVMGEKGVVKIGGTYLNKVEYADIEGYDMQVKTPSAPANQYGDYAGSMSNHGEVYKSMMDCLKKGKPYYTSPQEARATIALIKKIMNSNK